MRYPKYIQPAEQTRERRGRLETAPYGEVQASKLGFPVVPGERVYMREELIKKCEMYVHQVWCMMDLADGGVGAVSIDWQTGAASLN